MAADAVLEAINIYNRALYGDDYPPFVRSRSLTSCAEANIFKLDRADQRKFVLRRTPLLQPDGSCSTNRKIRGAVIQAAFGSLHPNLCPADSPFVYNNDLYVVMPRAVGDLFDFLRRRRFTEAAVRPVFQQIVCGVAYLHAHGIAHRDLKLQNVVVTEDGIVQIIDFGFCTVASRNYDGRVMGDACARSSCGTPGYAAPEVVAVGQRQRTGYDPFAADVFSLGVVLFGLLFRRLPKAPTADDPPTAAWQTTRHDTPISFELDILLRRLLAAEPCARPTLAALSEDPWFSVGLSPEQYLSLRMDYQGLGWTRRVAARLSTWLVGDAVAIMGVPPGTPAPSGTPNLRPSSSYHQGQLDVSLHHVPFDMAASITFRKGATLDSDPFFSDECEEVAGPPVIDYPYDAPLLCRLLDLFYNRAVATELVERALLEIPQPAALMVYEPPRTPAPVPLSLVVSFEVATSAWSYSPYVPVRSPGIFGRAHRAGTDSFGAVPATTSLTFDSSIHCSSSPRWPHSPLASSLVPIPCQWGDPSYAVSLLAEWRYSREGHPSQLGRRSPAQLSLRTSGPLPTFGELPITPMTPRGSIPTAASTVLQPNSPGASASAVARARTPPATARTSSTAVFPTNPAYATSASSNAPPARSPPATALRPGGTFTFAPAAYHPNGSSVVPAPAGSLTPPPQGAGPPYTRAMTAAMPAPTSSIRAQVVNGSTSALPPTPNSLPPTRVRTPPALSQPASPGATKSGSFASELARSGTAAPTHPASAVPMPSGAVRNPGSLPPTPQATMAVPTGDEVPRRGTRTGRETLPIVRSTSRDPTSVSASATQPQPQSQQQQQQQSQQQQHLQQQQHMQNARLVHQYQRGQQQAPSATRGREGVSPSRQSAVETVANSTSASDTIAGTPTTVPESRGSAPAPQPSSNYRSRCGSEALPALDVDNFDGPSLPPSTARTPLLSRAGAAAASSARAISQQQQQQQQFSPNAQYTPRRVDF